MDLDQAARPLICNVQGLSLAIVNFSEGEDLTAAGSGPGVMGWELSQMEDQVRTLKSKVDAVIVVAHCGLEYIPFAPPYVMAAFDRMVDAGADLVIGHHPHVPQGIRFYRNVPICTSLGNFVFFQDTDLFFRKLGYLVQAGFGPEGLCRLEILPYQIHDQGLSLLSGLARENFFTRIKEISLPLDTWEGIEDAWNGFLHYYGQAGFENEVAMIMETLKADRPKGAAMFRNRLTTLQHFHHWKDMLHRMVTNTLETSPAWARDLAREWLTRRQAP
jgi:poly-gamma-glutamate synthesis protein (capsule biosynthesis protein)